MKVNINDEKYLEKLSKAVNSEDGQLILSYLQNEFDKISYDNIPTDKSFKELGQWFIVVKTIKNELKSIIDFLTRHYN